MIPVVPKVSLLEPREDRIHFQIFFVWNGVLLVKACFIHTKRNSLLCVRPTHAASLRRLEFFTTEYSLLESHLSKEGQTCKSSSGGTGLPALPAVHPKGMLGNPPRPNSATAANSSTYQKFNFNKVHYKKEKQNWKKIIIPRSQIIKNFINMEDFIVNLD
ncbi:hypothetical protein pb186bvf_003392 [Paramecium bursaria]